MELSEDDIREFITAWKNDFAEVLSEGEARHEASRLLDFLLLLARPLPSERGDGESREPTP